MLVTEMYTSNYEICAKFSHLVDSPINNPGAILDENKQVIGVLLSHQVCQIMGGSALDDMTVLSGEYGRLLRASFADDSDEDEEF